MAAITLGSFIGETVTELRRAGPGVTREQIAGWLATLQGIAAFYLAKFTEQGDGASVADAMSVRDTAAWLRHKLAKGEEIITDAERKAKVVEGWFLGCAVVFAFTAFLLVPLGMGLWQAAKRLFGW
ncbi:MAG: hypothetical protein LBC18_10825 [Opitutaceae bacterium]|nr:hypothetical protein [Opitutaceae bacterium]